MDVDKLEKMLKGMTDQEVKPVMQKIAHWVSRIKKEEPEPYQTGIPSEIHSLQQLRDLGLFKIQDKGKFIEVRLTDKARELSKDFFQKGYYLRG